MMDKNNEQSFNERRKFRRFDIPLHLIFKSSSNSANYLSGQIKNFSRYGFCFESQKTFLQINDSMDFIVKLPARETFIPVQGDIVWTKDKSDKILAGIRISQIDKGAKCEILDYGYDSWLEEAKKKKLSFDTYENYKE